MKKFFRSIIFFIFLILLVSCSSLKTKTFSEKTPTDGGNVLKIICHYNKKDDKIFKMEIDEIIDENLNSDEIKKVEKELKDAYSGYEGITFSTKYENNELIFTLKMNFEKMNLDNAVMYYPILGGIDFIEIDEFEKNGKIKYIVKANETFDMIKKAGYVEK